jgi:hypothetical protein
MRSQCRRNSAESLDIQDTSETISPRSMIMVRSQLRVLLKGDSIVNALCRGGFRAFTAHDAGRIFAASLVAAAKAIVIPATY